MRAPRGLTRGGNREMIPGRRSTLMILTVWGCCRVGKKEKVQGVVVVVVVVVEEC